MNTFVTVPPRTRQSLINSRATITLLWVRLEPEWATARDAT
jgi:hypothetical protein